MAMTPLFRKFPQMATRETRTVRLQNYGSVPDGEYGFIEFYCDEPGCDCRRVVAQVWSPTSGSKVWATINYGWESEEFYKRWAHGIYEDMKGPVLDPINPQSPHAETFLELFKTFVQDEDYVARLKRHYEAFRNLVRNAKASR